MKGSLAKARVLYAPVEEVDGEERLLRASRIHILWPIFYFYVNFFTICLSKSSLSCTCSNYLSTLDFFELS